MTEKPRHPNPTDQWLAPEQSRMASDLKRFRYGIRNPDGTYLVYPGERILPEPECLRHQRETERRLRESGEELKKSKRIC